MILILGEWSNDNRNGFGVFYSSQDLHCWSGEKLFPNDDEFGRLPQSRAVPPPVTATVKDATVTVAIPAKKPPSQTRMSPSSKFGKL